MSIWGIKAMMLRHVLFNCLCNYEAKPPPMLLLLVFLFHSTTATKPLGSDRDSHNCISSAGYKWCSAESRCVRVWEEPRNGPCGIAAHNTDRDHSTGSDADNHRQLRQTLGVRSTVVSPKMSGVYTDPNHYQPGQKQWSGVRTIAASKDKATIVGTDDNVSWWTLEGLWVDKPWGELIVNFGQKSKSKEDMYLTGKYECVLAKNVCGIKWEDGNVWSKVFPQGLAGVNS